jgi:aldehyde dehydrogenase (NAD+)
MMVLANELASLRHADRFFVGGEWVRPASTATIEVIDSGTEQVFFRVAEAQEADMAGAIAAARHAFDDGPWPRLTHAERAEYLQALATGLRSRGDEVAQMWPRESGILYSFAEHAAAGAAGIFEFYAELAHTFPFEEVVQPTAGGEFGLLIREPVGVVGAIVAWNGPLGLISHKIAPALLAGCTVIIKSSPEAPGEGYVVAEVAESIGLPPGVVNMVTADRQVSELLVRDPRVDKITFTGSNATGRRIATWCGERIARYTLELGGKSAAVILDDMDIGTAANTLAMAERQLTGQMCASLTRIVVNRDYHDELVDALSSTFSQLRVGDPFDPQTQMGPLAARASAIGSRAISPRASPRGPPWPPVAAAPSISSGAGLSSPQEEAISGDSAPMCVSIAWYRAPWPPWGAMESSVFRSASVSSTSAARALSSTSDGPLTPGIGTMSGPRDRSQASASCAGVIPFACATRSTCSASWRLASKS